MAQYFLVHPVNPQRRLVRQATDIVRDGGLIAYPTDSCYALGCRLGDAKALGRLRRLRGMDEKHHLTLMCRDLSEIAAYAIVDNVQQKFTLFNPSGIPVRATLTMSFKEYKTLEEQLKELNLQTSDQTKLVRVRQRMTLAQIAFEEYGDASLWRHIADHEENRRKLADLRRLTPGVELHVPYIDALKGARGPRRASCGASRLGRISTATASSTACATSTTRRADSPGGTRSAP